jgi:2OG-Fe(II) oxygenase superfamily
MAAVARDRLGKMLRGEETSAFSVELKARPDDLVLEVEGLGVVKSPVTAAKARKLIELGRPARFGRGEETVTDPGVRDTWEIPKNLVRATWNAPMLAVILATVKEELGLPAGAELTADLHSLLVYEPNQFFLAHQDSEKDDAMVGTLVVTLPSTYTGGDLMIGHNEEWNAYRGSKTELSLVAFYADCQHEVLRVKSGYRITLTYNLLLHGDISRPEGEDGKVAEAVALLREHFATPASRYSYGEPADPPNRLVFFLDHEYTPRALGWPRLKGADAARAAVLRAAAERASCEAILALADIKTTHSAFAEERRYGRRHWDWDWDEDEDDGDDYDFTRTEISDTGKFDVQELIDSEITLTHWTGPDGRRLEETSLAVSDAEVCAATENGDLTPYSTEYEGYMGNWGNTLDRWYHRAAIVVWPRSQAFANRAETSPSWALDELTTMAAEDRKSAVAVAGTLEPFWKGSVRGLTSGETGPAGTLLNKALRTAVALGDAEAAQLLLQPFRVELLADEHAEALASAARSYGQQWTASLLRGWFGDGQPAWSFSEPGRNQWIAGRLPGLTQALDRAGGEAAAAARLLLDLSWAWLGERIHGSCIVPSPRLRDQLTAALGEPLSAVLASAASLGAAPVLDAVRVHLTKQPDPVTVLELATLRAAASSWAAPTSGTAGGADLDALGALAADCAARLRARLALPQRADGDWSIELPAGCTCELCASLRKYLAGPDRVFEWPLAEQRRRHVHERIDRAELPVTHLTRRQGRPYTLVLTKTDALFTGERDTRATAAADLTWLAAHWPATEEPQS